ncbi:MAG TPA: sigma-54 dependent transcriptional regulator [bacterium]|nr:sigma-54 dependent transcriptional regulator [bacterium]HQG45397.1 sigma-54 dependent transcriptional regulator [bacterium]HQI48669.1 sigma-54 dependent transcriptional regulator [bacterium]HQJ64688.1 sigma-54 dependent transcriptional regulator [bacterium]
MKAETLKILIIDDEDLLREGCRRLLEMAGYEVATAADAEEGLQKAASGAFGIVFVDFRMPGMTGIEFIRRMQESSPTTDVVMMTGYASIEMAVEAMKNGARDYISKPFEAEQLLEIVSRLARRHAPPASQPAGELDFTLQGKSIRIIGRVEAMQELFALVRKVAPTDSTVLIEGESGTGKEMIARAIHALSNRKNKPFYAMDCGSLVESLFESELFGHVKGSFTGATATKHGALELAHGGTFFFDEIGNISLNVQAKVLRAIQEKEIRRIGSTQTIPVDVRVIAATNRDLRAAVAAGEFREDLYYRLSVIPIRLPPLRERVQDIDILLDHFIQKHNKRRQQNPIEKISPEVLDLFRRYPWPGNIRELENVIERAAVIEAGTELRLHSLPPHLRSFPGQQEPAGPTEPRSLVDVEKDHIRKTLERCRGNISHAARLLGIDRKTLYEKIRRYDLSAS